MTQTKFCTKDNPYNGEDVTDINYVHNDAEETEASMMLDGSSAEFYCPNCNIKFWVYLGD